MKDTKAPIEPLMDLFATGNLTENTKYYDCYSHGYNLGFNEAIKNAATNPFSFICKMALSRLNKVEFAELKDWVNNYKSE